MFGYCLPQGPQTAFTPGFCFWTNLWRISLADLSHDKADTFQRFQALATQVRTLPGNESENHISEGRIRIAMDQMCPQGICLLCATVQKILKVSKYGFGKTSCISQDFYVKKSQLYPRHAKCKHTPSAQQNGTLFFLIFTYLRGRSH